MLERLAALHARFVAGAGGGIRLNIALRAAPALDFTGKDLTEAELRGARLAGSSFVGARPPRRTPVLDLAGSWRNAAGPLPHNG